MTFKLVISFLLITFTVSCIKGFTIKLKNLTDTSTSITNKPYLTPPELIKQHGYPAQVHIVQSPDGYLLQLHRIPYGKKKLDDTKRMPILLHHGFLSSSVDWVINGPKKSLGYMLADAGYDVWMMNARGNTYSRNHIKYNILNQEFWDFSFHEMAIYDLPATIDYILKASDQKQLVYIGHSLGTTIFYAMASSLPKYNSKIKLQISLAPVAAISHTTSAFKLWAPLAEMIKRAADLYYKGSLLSHDDFSANLIPVMCGKGSPEIDVCEEVLIGPFFGEDREQLNAPLFSYIWDYTPAGTSTKNMVHCSQLITSGSFRQYDYGEAGNLKQYKTKTPPSYNLTKISVPVRIYYGGNDVLSDPTDSKRLYNQFSVPLGLVRVPYDKFNHVDFLWAKNLDRLLNDELIEFIDNSTDIKFGSGYIQHNVQRALNVRTIASAQGLHIGRG